MKSVILIVRGRVQGVAFRYSCMHKAQELQLSGFVTNQTDGSVYIEASGKETEIELFILWCKQGPTRARVDELRIEESEKIHQHSFQIR